jgi:5-methylthioadenosine/S-adenosylhomocysteine deaminase
MIDLLIRNANIITPEAGKLVYKPGFDILIRGNRIDAILKSGSVDPSQATLTIAATGMLALPGLINTHCHTAMVVFRGMAEDVTVEQWFNDYIWPAESNLTPEDVYWGTLLGLVEMIEAGVTTVADHYFAMDSVAQAVEEAGTRGALAWAAFSAGVEDPEAQLNRTIEFCERWQNAADGRITTWLGPHSPYTCSEAFLKLVAAEAKRRNLGIHIHVSETARQVKQSLETHGRTPVAILRDAGIFENPTLLAHAAHPAADDIQIMAKANVGVAHCPKTFLRMASGIAPVVKMRSAGINVGIGTDGAASNSTYDILEQMRLAAMMQKHENGDPVAMPINDAFQMAFTDGAQAVQLPDLGALQAGKLADLILLRADSARMQPMLNPMANVLYSAQSGDIDTVICNGKMLMYERQLLTLNKAKIVSEVNARLERLTHRDGDQRIQTYPT